MSVDTPKKNPYKWAQELIASFKPGSMGSDIEHAIALAEQRGYVEGLERAVQCAEGACSFYGSVLALSPGASEPMKDRINESQKTAKGLRDRLQGLANEEKAREI